MCLQTIPFIYFIHFSLKTSNHKISIIIHMRKIINFSTAGNTKLRIKSHITCPNTTQFVMGLSQCAFPLHINQVSSRQEDIITFEKNGPFLLTPAL